MVVISNKQNIYLQGMLKTMLVVMLVVLSISKPTDIIKFSISSYILPNKQLEMELDVVAPRSPNSYPTILYLTGLSGLAPSFFQSNVIDSVAEQGYIFLTVTKLQSPLPDHMTKVLAKVIDWLNDNFQSILANRVPGVIADIQNKFILMGHSAAGHVTTQYLNDTCGNVRLQILINPVDGVDPFGIKNEFITHPGQFLPYATPVLVVAAQMDPLSRFHEPACAPNNISNMRFYNAMSGPKWFLNVSKYGHVDFFNNQYRDVATVACATCKSGCDFSQYRTYIKEVILSFIDAILNKSEIAMKVIEDAKLLIQSQHQHDYMGYDPLKRGGFCERKNENQHLVVE